MCPTGFYCPPGTYEEIPCRPGTVGKYEGAENQWDCRSCKPNTYNDVWGAGGCKRCGPTSFSEPDPKVDLLTGIPLVGENRLEDYDPILATTCQCVGKYRVFIKSSGSCLCGRGFRPVQGKENVDSLEDCEADIKAPCPAGEVLDGEGNCLGPEAEADVCARQCVDGKGKFVQGTGLCACEQINDQSEVCNASCQATVPKLTMSRDGMLTVDDRTRNGRIPGRSLSRELRQAKSIDPSTIPGYYGDFRCEPAQGSTECNTFTLGMEPTGDFSFDYGTNPAVLAKAGVEDLADRSSNSLFTSFHKNWRNLEDGEYKGRSGRLL
jgi:hypothetical protein